METKVFIDSSAWIAYALTGEPHHETLVRLFQKCIQEKTQIYTSSDVIDETVTRLVYDTHVAIVQTFIEKIQTSIAMGALLTLWTTEDIQQDAVRLVLKYIEHRLSLTDATSIIHMRRQGIDTIITLDRDFAHVGVQTLPEV